jgi:hypothetical protein
MIWLAVWLFSTLGIGVLVGAMYQNDMLHGDGGVESLLDKPGADGEPTTIKTHFRAGDYILGVLPSAIKYSNRAEFK